MQAALLLNESSIYSLLCFQDTKYGITFHIKDSGFHFHLLYKDIKTKSPPAWPVQYVLYLVSDVEVHYTRSTVKLKMKTKL